MNIEEEVFNRYEVNLTKLKKYGFKLIDKSYVFNKEIIDNFEAIITVDKKGIVTGKVIDLDLNEEYINIRNKSLNSGFVYQVREAYISILEDIRDKCFIRNRFIYPQTKRIFDYIKKQYKTNPEYLWKKYPDYAVFRNSNSGKWFGIVMNVSGTKIGLDKNEYEVLDVKVDNNSLEELYKINGIVPAYHMNKDSWISIILNDVLDDEIIYSLIDYSYTQMEESDVWLVPANNKYYDVIGVLSNNEEIEWKPVRGVKPGDIIYIYMSEPYSCIMFKCLVLKDEYSVRLRKLETYSEDKYPYSYLKEIGIKMVRGPRRINKDIANKL